MIERIRRALARHDQARPAPPREPAPAWRDVVKARVSVAAIVFIAWAGVIEAKLAYLQIYRHSDLVARAVKQQMRTREAPPKRGDIVDRRGRVLATSVDADSIYAVPSEVGNPDEVVRALCGVFGDCNPRERQMLADRLRKQGAFAYIRRQVSPEEARRVAALNLDGIGFMKESRRFYPNKELAAHLVGYVGVDNGGLSGLEFAYDSQIRGKPGTVLIQTDARRHAFSRTERPPTAGATIELTIDEYLQHIAERELHNGVVRNHAAGGTAIVMNPHTGEILALANEPTFNPNIYREYQESERRNRAVQDLYEPGSTFKVVTASAAIEEKVMPLNSWIDVSGGKIKIGNRVVHDTHDYHALSFTDVIVKSSNVGAIKIGFRVGTDRLSEYVRRYGFGRPASPDFPGESPGIVWDKDKWTDSALMSVSMGYQVGVTALQMAAAVSAVANGGQLVEPRVVRAIYKDNRRFVVQPKIVRRTTSANTAAALTAIMEGVVEEGTGKAARMPGYTVAGKTGTASKLVNGHYSHADYNASFVGFVPSQNPAVTIIVVIDSPHAGSYYGGSVSAPVFKDIAEPTLRYLGVGPNINPASPVLVARQSDGGGANTSTADAQEPVVSLVADGPPGALPDLTGMTAREAVRTLVKIGLVPRVTGDGVVVSQEPPPGSAIDTGSVCRLVLERAPARHTSAAQP